MTLHPDRRVNVGSSEVASLFSLDLYERGEKAYESRFELWHRKAGLLPNDPYGDNPRLFWGRHLEAGIAAGVRQMFGWNLRKVRRYIRHPWVEGMGASLDYEVVDHPLGPGVVELKNVDEDIFRRWPEVDGVDDPAFCEAVGVPCLRRRREPPLRLQLQPQHQLGCTGRRWAVLAILHGGNELLAIPYPRVEITISRIEAEIPPFLQSIRDGVPPPVDWSIDAATVIQLYGKVDDLEVANLRGDEEAMALAIGYIKASAEEAAAGDRRTEYKARLLQKMGTARKAYVGKGISISAPIITKPNQRPYRGFQLHHP